MDWNWFFSALAQSAAAIVGIFAAFIITKIIGNQIEFKKRMNECDSLLSDCIKLIDRINLRYIDWYNEKMRDEQNNKLDEIIYENESTDPEFYYQMLNYSPYDNKELILEHITLKIEQLIIPHDEDNTVMPDAEHDGQNSPLNSAFLLGRELREQRRQYISSLAEERELIDQVALEIKHHARKVVQSLLQITGNPESSPLVNISIISIIILFYAGVIYPLSFVPIDNTRELKLSFMAFFDILFSLKGYILAIISIIFNFIMIVFFVVNIRLKYPPKIFSELSKYSYPGNYSEYIANLINSQKDVE